MLVSSWGLEDGVTSGRQRKWVRGGFFWEGGFLGPFRLGMVSMGWVGYYLMSGGEWCRLTSDDGAFMVPVVIESSSGGDEGLV